MVSIWTFPSELRMLVIAGSSGVSDKLDPGDVAEIGFKAMLKGEADVVAGLKNKLTVAMSKLTPSQVLAEKHRKLAEPGSASQT